MCSAMNPNLIQSAQVERQYASMYKSPIKAFSTQLTMLMVQLAGRPADGGRKAWGVEAGGRAPVPAQDHPSKGGQPSILPDRAPAPKTQGNAPTGAVDSGHMAVQVS